jgi:hypothetical protein
MERRRILRVSRCNHVRLQRWMSIWHLHRLYHQYKLGWNSTQLMKRRAAFLFSHNSICLGWCQKVLPATVSSVTFELRYWAKCMSASCANIQFGINNPCTPVFAPAVTFTNTWTQYTVRFCFFVCFCFTLSKVDMNALLASCTTGFGTARWNLGAQTGQRFLLDTAIWFERKNGFVVFSQKM